MQLHQRLQCLLERPDAESARVRDELGAMLEQYPMEFRTWAVSWICNGGRGARARLLLRLLHQKNLLRSLLVNPGAMPLRDAVRVARLAQHSVSNLDGIIAATIREGTVTQAARALQVLQHVPLSGRVVPGLAAALRNPDAKIRSLVSKLMGRLCDRPTAIRALLKDHDARVRANAVEGFWGSTHPVARDFLRQCLRDADNRVAANAALGLCKIGDPDGTAALRSLSAHHDHRHRISAAWAIAQTGDPALRPVLEALAEDRIPKVRSAAYAALDRIKNAADADADPGLLVAVSHAYRTPAGVLKLRALITDEDDNPVENLSPDSFRVFEDAVLLSHDDVILPATRDAMITVIWLATHNLTQPVRAKGSQAIVEAMAHKRWEDQHCVVGAGLHAGLAFSTDLGQLRAALEQAGPDVDASSNSLESLLRVLTRTATRPGCRTVVAFSGGSPLSNPHDLDQLVQEAVSGEVSIHVVGFDAGSGIAPEWRRIAAETQGSYRIVTVEDELYDAFWWAVSQISRSYAIAVHGASASDAEFRLEVRSPSDYGEARFEPLLLHPADNVSTGEGVPAEGRHVK